MPDTDVLEALAAVVAALAVEVEGVSTVFPRLVFFAVDTRGDGAFGRASAVRATRSAANNAVTSVARTGAPARWAMSFVTSILLREMDVLGPTGRPPRRDWLFIVSQHASGAVSVLDTGTIAAARSQRGSAIQPARRRPAVRYTFGTDAGRRRHATRP
jgi:hypothetical protein